MSRPLRSGPFATFLAGDVWLGVYFNETCSGDRCVASGSVLRWGGWDRSALEPRVYHLHDTGGLSPGASCLGFLSVSSKGSGCHSPEECSLPAWGLSSQGGGVTLWYSGRPGVKCEGSGGAISSERKGTPCNIGICKTAPLWASLRTDRWTVPYAQGARAPHWDGPPAATPLRTDTRHLRE